MKDRNLTQHQQSQSDTHPSKGWLQRRAVRSLPSNENEVKPPVVGESGLNRSFVHIPVLGHGLPPVQRTAFSSASLPSFPQQFSQHPASQVSRPNQTGLPDRLKTGIENLSGYSMDNVRVHYNSNKPAQLQAHAYAQGTDIHLGTGQEKHLPHEAWHVVQQKQGRVKPTMQMKGKVNINDDAGLEKEADVMGIQALQMKTNVQNETIRTTNYNLAGSLKVLQYNANSTVIQRFLTDNELDELREIDTVDCLVEWLITAAIEATDVPAGIEHWLKANPSQADSRGKIYERVGFTTLQQLPNVNALVYGNRYIDNDSDADDVYKNDVYKYIGNHTDDIINLLSLENNGLYQYTISTHVLTEHALSQYHDQDPLTHEQSATARMTILGPEVEAEGDVAINAKDIQDRSMKQMVTALGTYVNDNLQVIRDSDNLKIDVGADSSRGRILSRAVQNILTKYGLAINYAAALEEEQKDGDTSARDNLLAANIKHSTERWSGADGGEKKQAGNLAVVWAMSNVSEVNDVVTQTRTTHHELSSIGTVIGAYSAAIAANGVNANLMDNMAEIRLRWGPITYGPDIYLEVATSRNNLDDRWWLYKTLIHEALHSAEHPNFTAFLANNIPEGLQSDIKEGIVEYLTQKIWTDVVRGIEVDERGDPQNLDDLLKVSKTRLFNLPKSYPAYGAQVKMITDLVEALENGDDRLVGAYFGGNVAAFLPTLN